MRHRGYATKPPEQPVYALRWEMMAFIQTVAISYGVMFCRQASRPETVARSEMLAAAALQYIGTSVAAEVCNVQPPATMPPAIPSAGRFSAQQSSDPIA